MKKRDLLLIVSLALVAGIMMVVGLNARKPVEKAIPEVSETTDDLASEAIQLENFGVSAQEKASAFLEANPAESYLYIEANGGVLVIPLSEERSIPLDQGNNVINTIHTGVNSVYMESSTCDNQNCVEEGEITLENRQTRILYNMIICIPHNLLLELLTPEETAERMTELYIAQAEVEAKLNAALAATENPISGEADHAA